MTTIPSLLRLDDESFLDDDEELVACVGCHSFYYQSVKSTLATEKDSFNFEALSQPVATLRRNIHVTWPIDARAFRKIRSTSSTTPPHVSKIRYSHEFQRISQRRQIHGCENNITVPRCNIICDRTEKKLFVSSACNQHAQRVRYRSYHVCSLFLMLHWS